MKGFKVEHDIKENGVVVPLEGATAKIDISIDGRLSETIIPTISNDVISYSLDFQNAGLYEIQGEITFPNGSVIPTSIDKFKVKHK